jgi:alpha-galactosidase
VSIRTTRHGRRRSQLLVAFVLVVGACLTLTSCGSSGSGAAQLAETPPMGWNSWNHFGCSVTEADVKAAADAIVSDGLRADGYDYVDVDDCWQAPTRDRDGRLTADPARFPHGMAALAAFVHSKGLRLGIYAAPGAQTCAERYQGYPGQLGSLGHERQDAQTFASWGVDYLKYDWCGADRDGVGHEAAFATMRAALDATGRPIVLSIHDKPEQPVPAWRRWVSQLSRTTPDIQDSWSSVISIVRSTLTVRDAASPGHWNDPDMLEIGNGGMTLDEERSHLALWAQLSAPLLIGCDLTTVSPQSLGVLTERRVIRVDQDRLGAPPAVLASSKHELVLLKPLSNGSSALTITNVSSRAATITVPVPSPRLGDAVTTQNLWTGVRGRAHGHLTVRLSAHATAIYRISH